MARELKQEDSLNIKAARMGLVTLEWTQASEGPFSTHVIWWDGMKRRHTTWRQPSEAQKTRVPGKARGSGSEREMGGGAGWVKLDRGSRGYGIAAGKVRAISMGIELQDGGGRSYIFSDKQKGFDRLVFHLAEMIARCTDMHRFIMYLGE